MWYSTKEEAENAIEEFKRITCTKYIVDYCRSYVDTKNKRVRWDYETGIPFIIIGSSRFECEHGKDKNLLKKEKCRNKNSEEGKKRYNCIQGSKKLGCNAKICVVEFLQFPQFKLKGAMNYKHRLYSKKIHRSLANEDDQLARDYKCKVEFPEAACHFGHAVLEVDVKPSKSEGVETKEDSSDVDPQSHETIGNLIDQIQHLVHKVPSLDVLKQAEVDLASILNNLLASKRNSNLQVQDGKLNEAKRLHENNSQTIPDNVPEKMQRTETKVQECETLNLQGCSTSHSNTEELQSDCVRRFAPNYSFLQSNLLNQIVVSSGPHSTSLLDLLSLELNLNKEEKEQACSLSTDFKVGLVCSQVIDSYLWNMCRDDFSLLYAGSDAAAMLQEHSTVEGLWENRTLSGKRYLFIPWNPDGNVWILLAVDVNQQSLLYLNPSNDLEAEEMDARALKAKTFVDRVMLEKFKWKTKQVSSPHEIFKTDHINSGVCLCMFAKCLAFGESLQQPKLSLVKFRKHIYDSITRGCLNNLFADRNVDL